MEIDGRTRTNWAGREGNAAQCIHGTTENHYEGSRQSLDLLTIGNCGVSTKCIAASCIVNVKGERQSRN